MAIADIKMGKIARELQEWIYLGIEDGMVRSAADYKRLLAEGRTTEAENMLVRAADMSFRALVRVEDYEARYGADYLDKCLAIYGYCTLAELKAAIVEKQTYAKEKALEIVDEKIDNTTIAVEIISTVHGNAQDWAFPIPAGYKDIVTVEREKAAKEKEAKEKEAK